MTGFHSTARLIMWRTVPDGFDAGLEVVRRSEPILAEVDGEGASFQVFRHEAGRGIRVHG